LQIFDIIKALVLIIQIILDSFLLI